MTYEFKKLKAPQSRTYRFAGGDSITITGVTEIAIGTTTHRLTTADGKLHIVSKDFLHIEIDNGGQGWTF